MSIQAEKVVEFSGHGAPTYSLAQGRKEFTVFSAGADGRIAEWDLKNREPVEFSVNVGHSIFSIHHVQEKGLLLVGRSSGAFHIIDLEGKKEIKLFDLHKKGIFDFSYSPKHNKIFALGGDGVLSIWNADELDLYRSIPLSDRKLRKVAMDQNEERIALACGDARIRVLEMEMYNEVETFVGHSPGANAVVFHPYKERLITSGRNAHIDIWELGAPESPLKSIPAHYYAVYGLVPIPEKGLLASSSRDKTIKFWDLDSGDFLCRIDRQSHLGHGRSVNALFWSEACQYLVSTGDDGKVMAWGIK